MRAYKERIKRYNQSEKYQEEMNFLIDKIKIKESDLILDYGCGTGYMANKIGAYGFDVNNYNIYLPTHRYKNDFSFHVWFNKVYFMHAIAHIDVQELIDRLSSFDKCDIFIFTPDKGFLDETPNAGIDPTATHFYKKDLEFILTQVDYKIIESITVKDNIYIHAVKS